jgi:hypothetical protein
MRERRTPAAHWRLLSLSQAFQEEPCSRSRLVCPSVFRSEPGTWLKHPAACAGTFVFGADTSSSRTEDTWTCHALQFAPSMGAPPWAGAPGRRAAKINFRRLERKPPSRVFSLTPGGVPPAPQPLTHPATDPGPSGAGVFFFCAKCAARTDGAQAPGRRTWPGAIVSGLDPAPLFSLVGRQYQIVPVNQLGPPRKPQNG